MRTQSRHPQFHIPRTEVRARCLFPIAYMTNTYLVRPGCSRVQVELCNTSFAPMELSLVRLFTRTKSRQDRWLGPIFKRLPVFKPSMQNSTCVILSVHLLSFAPLLFSTGSTVVRLQLWQCCAAIHSMHSLRITDLSTCSTAVSTVIQWLYFCSESSIVWVHCGGCGGSKVVQGQKQIYRRLMQWGGHTLGHQQKC